MRLLTTFALLSATGALADPAIIEDVELRSAGTLWTVSVTLRHADTGWDDYADGWRIETPEGRVLAVRELLHPHVSEQPFTRSLSGVALPDGLDEIVVRARTNVTGWDSLPRTVRVPD